MSEEERIGHLLREYDNCEGLYQLFCNEVQRIVEALTQTADIPVSAITSRRKSRDSFEKKIVGDNKY